MTLRAGLRLVAGALAIPTGVAASIGLIDALRSLPGPSLALALPLRETGHDDRAAVAVVVLVSALVFGLLAAALGPWRAHPVIGALMRVAGVLACALVLQAVSLQLVRQASAGLDWRGALSSPAPFACALGALLGFAAVGASASSDRRRRTGPKERPVEGRSGAPPLAKIGT